MKLLTACSLVAALAGLSAAFPSAAPNAPVGAGETFAVDNAHSTVIFRTKHLGISEAYGRFNKLSDESQLLLDADSSKSSLRLVVETESVDTGLPDRDKHLRNADFFNSKEHPEIVFESKKISGSYDALQVVGDLTFLGKTKSVTAKGRQVGKGDTAFGDHRVGFVADFSFSMADFDVAFVKQSPGAVGPEVHVTVSLECIRK
jgi:polyisoprenoid-binding protein YceI